MKNVFIISGVAGSGKDTVIDGLQKLLPVQRIITTTTRAMRTGETEGCPYYFQSRTKFEENIATGNFAEYSTNENGELYGVTHTELKRITATGKITLWRVDWKGVVTIKKSYPEILALYISAPLEILEKRLRARDKGKDETYFQERMHYTEEWLKHLDIYDYIIDNEEGKLEDTIQRVKEIIEAHLEK